MIDLVLHNSSCIESCVVIGCPISDHSFVLFNIAVVDWTDNNILSDKVISCRNLSEANLIKINKWSIFKDMILNSLDKIAPLRELQTMNINRNTPWIDLELIVAKTNRDKAYKVYSSLYPIIWLKVYFYR